LNLFQGRVYLFLFAHPDDEVFIVGTMRQLLVKGPDVHAAWLTSGDYGGKGQVRERELAEAMNILGLHRSRIHVMRLPDLGLVRIMERAADEVTKLMDRIRPDVVFANAFEGGHPDHDAVNFLAYEGSFRAGLRASLFEFPLYNGSGPALHWWWQINAFPPGNGRTFYNRLDDDEIERKYRIMRAYSSQWLYMAPARMASSYASLKRRGEPYRPCPKDRDHSLPPYKGELNYERWFNDFMKIRFSDFRAAVLKTRRSR
jgi:LmbE family N-acetylglucosaminyl deacetylase